MPLCEYVVGPLAVVLAVSHKKQAFTFTTNKKVLLGKKERLDVNKQHVVVGSFHHRALVLGIVGFFIWRKEKNDSPMC